MALNPSVPNVPVNANYPMCDVKISLLGDYRAKAAAYAETVEQLHRLIGISPKEEYRRLRHASEVARNRADQARLLLEKHVAEHLCEREEIAMGAGQSPRI